MKKTAIFILVLSFVTAAAAAAVYNQGNFSAVGRMYQPLPKGISPGKDNIAGSGMHHRGEECGRCHSEGRRAERYTWTAAGTFYTDRSGKRVLQGGEVILEDRDGNVVTVTSNQAGNFYTNAPIASNPYAVASHSPAPPEPLYTLDGQGNLLTPADPMDQRSWQYKAWVKSKGSVRPMLTLVPVGSAMANMGGRMSCSMHHSSTGSRGALWAASAPTLPSYPATGLSYRKHIYPILRSKCSPCHIPGSTITRQVTKSDIDPNPTTIDFSSGLDLMFYEGSSVSGITKIGVASVVNVNDPEQSLLLEKPCSIKNLMHAGGRFWNSSSPDYLALRQWISEGALKN